MAGRHIALSKRAPSLFFGAFLLPNNILSYAVGFKENP